MSQTADGSTQDVLIERARRLADRPNPEDLDVAVEFLVCRVGNGDYAIELGTLSSVQRSAGLTRVPCTSPTVAGILNVRGELLTVLDLCAALGGPPISGQPAQVLLVDMPHARVGLLVDEVLGVERLALNGLDPPLSGAAYSRGVAHGTVVLLDFDQLLNERNFDDINYEL